MYLSGRVCLLVCCHKNQHFERYKAVYEPTYYVRVMQKSKNSFYMPHEQERIRTQEKQTFLVSLKVAFNPGDLSLKRLLYHSFCEHLLHDLRFADRLWLTNEQENIHNIDFSLFRCNIVPRNL